MATDTFQTMSDMPGAPSRAPFAVTPSDSVELSDGGQVWTPVVGSCGVGAGGCVQASSSSSEQALTRHRRCDASLFFVCSHEFTSATRRGNRVDTSAPSSWRMATGESLLHTDGGHLILDLACGVIPDPKALGAVLDTIPGVVEHGLFIGYAEQVIVGEASGARLVAKR